jgi:hypothetical protein
MKKLALAALVCHFVLTAASAAAEEAPNLTGQKDDGYRGIWFTLGQMGEHGDKYSGGLGTYTAKHRPLAVYSAEANKTFFTWGGGRNGERHLLILASYYDHATGEVPRPTIVHDKEGVNDPHDNGIIVLDGDGHVWVFVSGRGQRRMGFKYRSVEPYSVEKFEQVTEEEMTYPQPVWVAGRGFLHTFTKYTKGRELYWNTSRDGREWTEARKLAGMGGHYQVTEGKGDWVYTAFNMHPGGNVDKRTNLYFLKTDDMGETWRTADGTPVETPLEDVDSPALVRDFAAEGRLVYVKDCQFDRQGEPVLLVVTSGGYTAGPESDPRIWTIAHWKEGQWRFHDVTRSTHNYDMGQLWIEEDGALWRIIAPTEAGPQHWGTGGEMALWESRDEGASWEKVRDITRNSPLNHMYARRPVNAHRDFYALWADGNPDQMSASRLYFTNYAGNQVWRLPYDMSGAHAKPEAIFQDGK